MPESERLVRFHLLGQDLAFYTASSEEEVEQILSLVRQQIDVNSNQSGGKGTIPVHKVAVMTCLNLASRYLKLESEFESYKMSMEHKLGSLNERLDIILAAGK